MIKTLELRNFQGHKQSSFNFSPGVNVIKGTSHNGKTSVIRSIRWALLNRPAVGIVRNWHVPKSAEVKVAIEFDDGFIIRKSSKDFNGYVLPEQEFDAIGTNVPEEVERLADLAEVNLQGQHDKYFMLQEGPQVGAQKLNQIVGIEIIDEVMGRAAKEVQERKDTIKNCEANIQRVKDDLESYAYLDSLEPLIRRMDGNLSRSEEISKVVSKLEILKGQIVGWRSQDRSLQQFLTVETHYDRLVEKGKEYKKLGFQINKLQGQYYTLANLLEELDDKEEFLKIDYPVDVLANICDQITKIAQKRSSLQKLYESIRKLRSRKIEHSKDVRDAEKDLAQYEKELFASGICPLCGQEIESETSNHG